VKAGKRSKILVGVALFAIVAATAVGIWSGWSRRGLLDLVLQPFQNVIVIDEHQAVVDGELVLPIVPDINGQPEFSQVVVDQMWNLDTLVGWLEYNRKRTIRIEGRSATPASVYIPVLLAVAQSGRDRVRLSLEDKPDVSVGLLTIDRKNPFVDLSGRIDSTHMILFGKHGMALFETRDSLPGNFTDWTSKSQRIDSIADRICRKGDGFPKTSILVNLEKHGGVEYAGLHEMLTRLQTAVSIRNVGKPIPLVLDAGMWLTSPTISLCGATCGDATCDSTTTP